MTDTIRLTVSGAPRTKKTSNVAFRTGRKCTTCGKQSGPIVVQPSKAWREWLKTATVKVLFEGQWCACRSMWDREAKKYRLIHPELHIPDSDYNCAALIYREKNLGDTTGYMQGLADLIEKRDLITNDRQLVTWDGTKPLIDRHNPRVEITLTRVSVVQAEMPLEAPAEVELAWVSH